MTIVRKKKIQEFKPQNDILINWESFNGGLNTFSQPTELRPNELAQADNLMLTGAGIPTGRWGSQLYHQAGVGRVRMLDGYYNSLTSTNYLLAITDLGYLTYKTNASYTIIPGASFPSGYSIQSTQLARNTYIATSSLNLMRFNGTQLIPYVGIGSPTNVSAAFLSGATGYSTYSWRVTATTVGGGETLGAPQSPNDVKISGLPLGLASVSIRVTWQAPSAAPSVITGYNIYRGFLGDETYVASVDANTTSYLDQGQPASETIFPPNSNTTAGPQAKYILKIADRLILAGIAGDPSRVYISARYPYHDRFTAVDGGAYVYVSPDDGEDITGLGVQTLGTTRPLIIVYKQNSTYVIDINNTTTLGAYEILNPLPYLLTKSAGASSGDTVIAVENDCYSFGRKGLYSTGQEAQFLNQIRSNELSARIRPYVRSLSDQDFREANAAYIDYKYILSFPSRKETIIYDRQRLAFMGPWKTPFGITKWLRYFDPAGNEIWLAGADDGNVYQFSDSLVNDSGKAIAKIMRTKKETMGQWNMMKMLKYFYFLVRNVRGSVTINLRIEDRTGMTTTTKTVTIVSTTGDSGWGIDQWGDQQYGQSSATVTLTGEELARYSIIYKQFRVMQVEVIASGSNSNFEFLAVRASGVSLGPASLPSTDKV